MPKRVLPLLLPLALSLLLVPTRAATISPATKQVLVTVVADEKEPARSLTAADFVVVEDKATRDVTGAALAANPLSVLLLVDTSQPPAGMPIPAIARDLRQALTTFMTTVQTAAPDTLFAYGEFGGA